jgi:hypothetical protein
LDAHLPGGLCDAGYKAAFEQLTSLLQTYFAKV